MSGRRQWRCFHCDAVFRGARSAREHFGADQGALPACQIAAHHGHLVHYIRDLEEQLARYREEESDVMRAMYTMEGQHRAALQREEEKGYERGVRDMKALGYRTEEAA